MFEKKTTTIFQFFHLPFHHSFLAGGFMQIFTSYAVKYLVSNCPGSWVPTVKNCAEGE